MKDRLEVLLVLSSSPIHVIARASPLWIKIPLSYNILINMLIYLYISNIDTKFAPYQIYLSGLTKSPPPYRILFKAEQEKQVLK